MTQRCGSSKPTPTPLNDKVIRSRQGTQKKTKKGRSSLKEPEWVVDESHRHTTHKGGGARNCLRKCGKLAQKARRPGPPSVCVANFIQIAPSARARGDRQNDKKNNREYAVNHLNPGQSSKNVSCAINERPDYPDDTFVCL